MHKKIEQLLAAHLRHLGAENEGTDAEYERTGVELEEAKDRLLQAAPSASLPLTEDQIQRIYDRYGGDMFNCTRAIERHCQQAAPSTSTADALDAARYRWLRSTTNFVSNKDGERIDVRGFPLAWDEAIDAAIVKGGA